MLIEQLKDFKAAKENPYKYDREPYTYSSPEGRILVANDLAIKTLDMKLKFIQKLKAEEQEHPHSFINHILPYYGKDSYDATLRIDYNSVVECKARLTAALEEYKEVNDMSLFRSKVVAACNETGAYTKKLEGTVNVKTINKVLESFEIPERLGHKRETYDVILPD